MQKKIANFYPFPIRLGGWGKVFLFIFFSLGIFFLKSQSVAHSYRKQPTERDKIYGGSSGSLSLTSSKTANRDTLYNFNTPYYNNIYSPIQYPILSKYSIASKSLRLNYTTYKPKDSTTGNLNELNNSMAKDKSGNYYLFKYQYFDNDKFRMEYQCEKYNSQFQKLWTKRFNMNGFVNQQIYKSNGWAGLNYTNKEDVIQEFNDGSFIHLNINIDKESKISPKTLTKLFNIFKNIKSLDNLNDPIDF